MINVKRTAMLISFIFIFFCVYTSMASAGNDVSVLINGTAVQFDQPPIIIDGRTLVPLRAICEAMGFEVFWFEEQQQIEIRSEQYYVVMQINNTELTKEDRMDKSIETIATDVPPQIINERTLIPLRAFSETFDSSVSWNGETQTVTIDNYYNNISIFMNDQKMENFDVLPFETNGVVYMPIRALAEYANLEVSWDEESQTIGINSNSINLELQVGNKLILKKIKGSDTVEVKPLYGDAQTMVFNGRTFVPVRSVFGALSAQMRWDNANKELYIYYE